MTCHTIKIGRPGTPGRHLAHKAEYIDADNARSLRWTYRHMRRCGVVAAFGWFGVGA